MIKFLKCFLVLLDFICGASEFSDYLDAKYKTEPEVKAPLRLKSGTNLGIYDSDETTWQDLYDNKTEENKRNWKL